MYSTRPVRFDCEASSAVAGIARMRLVRVSDADASSPSIDRHRPCRDCARGRGHDHDNYLVHVD